MKNELLWDVKGMQRSVSVRQALQRLNHSPSNLQLICPCAPSFPPRADPSYPLPTRVIVYLMLLPRSVCSISVGRGESIRCKQDGGQEVTLNHGEGVLCFI